jgi:hypothetical protein
MTTRRSSTSAVRCRHGELFVGIRHLNVNTLPSDGKSIYTLYDADNEIREDRKSAAYCL